MAAVISKLERLYNYAEAMNNPYLRYISDEHNFNLLFRIIKKLNYISESEAPKFKEFVERFQQALLNIKKQYAHLGKDLINGVDEINEVLSNLIKSLEVSFFERSAISRHYIRKWKKNVIRGFKLIESAFFLVVGFDIYKITKEEIRQFDYKTIKYVILYSPNITSKFEMTQKFVNKVESLNKRELITLLYFMSLALRGKKIRTSKGESDRIGSKKDPIRLFFRRHGHYIILEDVYRLSEHDVYEEALNMRA